MGEATTERQRLRLHLGCGDKRLEGWVNIDGQALPGVDHVADLRRPLEFRDVDAVFSEHLLEHLAIGDALALLLEIHRVLCPGGWLRLSTPNLDWVWRNCYVRVAGEPGSDLAAALVLNRSFHGWGHRFLWNEPLLREALAACGFEAIRACRYGESELPELAGLERHETYPDSPELSHVLILEARRGPAASERLLALRALVAREFLDHVDELFLHAECHREIGRLTAEGELLAAQAAAERERAAWVVAQAAAERENAALVVAQLTAALGVARQEVEILQSRLGRLEEDHAGLVTVFRSVERSASFRIGRALTAPVRRLRGRSPG